MRRTACKSGRRNQSSAKGQLRVTHSVPVMQLLGSDRYYVFPSYGREFQNMRPRLTELYSALGRDIRFWSGFSGGGVLGVPASHPISGHTQHNIVAPCSSLMTVYGCVLGNAAGESLAESVLRATPDRPPPLAVKLGLAQRVPDPTVKVTAEHASAIGPNRYLVVVPRMNRRRLAMIDRLSDWFDTFGVRISSVPVETPSSLAEQMSDWFDHPRRQMFVFAMQDGEDNAAWQLAVTYYIAEFWDTNARGLDSLHFVAAIDGEPCFRRNWTSNK